MNVEWRAMPPESPWRPGRRPSGTRLSQSITLDVSSISIASYAPDRLGQHGCRVPAVTTVRDVSSPDTHPEATGHNQRLRLNSNTHHMPLSVAIGSQTLVMTCGFWVRVWRRRRARSVTAGTQQPCWPSPSGAHEAMLMEDTSSVMDWLSPVPLGLPGTAARATPDASRAIQHSRAKYSRNYPETPRAHGRI